MDTKTWLDTIYGMLIAAKWTWTLHHEEQKTSIELCLEARAELARIDAERRKAI